MEKSESCIRTILFVLLALPVLAGRAVVLPAVGLAEEASLTAWTETSYLLDETGSRPRLSEDGDVLGELRLLPQAETYRLEIDRLYTGIFQKTLELSSDLEIARRFREQKYQQRYPAGAERYSPAVDFDLSQKHRWNYDEELSGLTEPGQSSGYEDGDDVTDWSVDLRLPIVKRSAMVKDEVAERELDVANSSLEIRLNELDARLRNLLGNYMVAVYRLLNLQNSVMISAEHVSRIKKGYQLRDQTRLALLRAQANLKELEARVDLEQQRLDTALRELLDFTSVPESDVILDELNRLMATEKQAAEIISSFARVDESLAHVALFLDQMSDDDLRHYYRANSLLYRKLELEKNLAEVEADRFTEQEWPELAVMADYGRKEDTRIEDFDNEGSVGLYLSVPLFTGGTLFSNSKARTEAQQVALNRFYKADRSLYNRVANRRKTLLSLRDIYEKQKVNLLQQEEVVRLSTKSYLIKQTSMQDLLTSKNRLIDAKNLLLRTTMDISSQARLLAWELGDPFPSPAIETDGNE